MKSGYDNPVSFCSQTITCMGVPEGASRASADAPGIRLKIGLISNCLGKQEGKKGKKQDTKRNKNNQKKKRNRKRKVKER